MTDPIENRETLYENNKEYYDQHHKERLDNLPLRDELPLPPELREKLEKAVTQQSWRTVRQDGPYATLPHQYTIRKKWVDDTISFDFFAELISYYGTVEIWKGTYTNWAGRKGQYLRIGSFKYWTGGELLEITTVINRENSNYKTHEEYRNHPNDKA
jgi:hypothetical protein